MNTYQWRSNFKAFVSNGDRTICGKLAFKTKNTQWINTTAPVIILVSIHSSIHEEMSGELKINALISTIKKNVKGKITVLLADTAHRQTLSLKGVSFNECILSAQQIKNRYHSYWENCGVVFWHSYILQDSNFIPLLSYLKELYVQDSIFRSFLLKDAEIAFTKQRKEEYPDKESFIEKTIEDLMEQCACIGVISNKGYRFQFYPGSSNFSTEYINQKILPIEKQVNWIDVFLSIEKKTPYEAKTFNS